MVKYSEQAKDKISFLLKNDNIKVIDISVENAILEILLNGIEFPKTWKNPKFSPANQYKDSLDVLGYFHNKDDWNISFQKDTEMFEVYVVDKKYSVANKSLSRAIMLALWNCNQLKVEV